MGADYSLPSSGFFAVKTSLIVLPEMLYESALSWTALCSATEAEHLASISILGLQLVARSPQNSSRAWWVAESRFLLGRRRSGPAVDGVQSLV